MEEKEEISSENPNEEEDENEEENEEEEEEQEEGEEDENNEEEILQDQIEEVDFGSLLKAKAKLAYNNSKNKSKQKTKTEIMNEMKAKNKTKLKNAPREYSALVKPKYQYKDQAHQQNTSLLRKKYHRDPRFDDLSGELNETSFKKNFSFVGEMAKEYVEKIDKVKNNKKYKQKMPQETYDLLKKQNNYVKGWINQQKQKESKQEIKTEINKENKKRMSKGQKPIYINKNKVNKFIKKQKNKSKDE